MPRNSSGGASNRASLAAARNCLAVVRGGGVCGRNDGPGVRHPKKITGILSQQIEFDVLILAPTKLSV
jgi:hypothetical protein